MFTVLHDVFLCIKNLALVIFFHYTTKEISQWKLNVPYVFFLENEGRTSGKNSSERCCLCLSPKQTSPVVTLKNFQNLQKSRGLSRTALFNCGLNEAFSSNSRSKQTNAVMAVAKRRQTSKLWLMKWICPCFASPTRIFLTVSSCCDWQEK